MSNKLEELPELGDVALSPRQNPNFVPDANFTTEDYFVWSRCDGVASIKQILQALGMGKQKSIEILARLREQGAISIGDETNVVSAEGTNGSVASPASSPSVKVAGVEERPSPRASNDGQAASQAKPDAGLSNTQQERIRSMIDVLDNRNLFEFLGVGAEANKRDVKRAYFRISKEFHPDRFYGKSLGEYQGQLSRIFETATKAYAMFSDERKRRAYLETVIGDGSKSSAQAAQTKEEHGEDLYKRACDLEIRGKQDEALRLFSAAVKSDGKGSYFKRAAMCALRADSLELAEEFAKKSVEHQSHDPSALRVLSDVYRSAGRLEEAETALEKALCLNSANDKLMGEIEKELRNLKDTRSTTNVEGG